MSKTSLQVRAEAAAQRFGSEARKPIVIEFAGVPEAGKTSTISQIQAFFKRCGFRVRIVVERASVCPIRDKKHSHFNVWTACTTLAQVLEHTQEHIGLDTNGAAADYIQLYDGEAETLTCSLERIQKTASEILAAIGSDDETPEPAEPQTPDLETCPGCDEKVYRTTKICPRCGTCVTCSQ